MLVVARSSYAFEPIRRAAVIVSRKSPAALVSSPWRRCNSPRHHNKPGKKRFAVLQWRRRLARSWRAPLLIDLHAPAPHEHGELVGQIGALGLARDPLADAVHVGTQRRVVALATEGLEYPRMLVATGLDARR